MTPDPADQQAVTRQVIGSVEELLTEQGLAPVRSVTRLANDTWLPEPLTTGAVLRSGTGRDHQLLVCDITRALRGPHPTPAPVCQALTQPEIDRLLSIASEIGDAVSGDREFPDTPTATFDVYDQMRSSVGQEYRLGPLAAGWHAIAGGRVVEVSVRYADPATAHRVRMEMDEEYAFACASLDDEHFETDSGTPPEADADDYDEHRLGRRLGDEMNAVTPIPGIPGSCDITGR